MITNDEQLNQAVEQLGRMYRALSSLKQEIEPASRARFAIMAEGPLDEIGNLEEAINAYTGKANVEAPQSDVWIRVVGPSIRWPDAPTSVLTALLDALRKGVQAVAEYASTGSLTTRPTKELKESCDFRVVAFESGSLCVGVRLPEPGQLELFPDAELPTAQQALKQYLAVAKWVASEAPPEELNSILQDPQTRRVVLNALKPFLPRPRGDVEAVELSGKAMDSQTAIRLSRESNQRVDSAIDLLETEQIETHTGDLREIDLDNCSFILRNAGDVTEIRCTFEDDILESAKSALDRRVEITGVRRLIEGRRAPMSLRVTRLEILDECLPNDQSQGE